MTRARSLFALTLTFLLIASILHQPAEASLGELVGDAVGSFIPGFGAISSMVGGLSGVKNLFRRGKAALSNLFHRKKKLQPPKKKEDEDEGDDQKENQEEPPHKHGHERASHKRRSKSRKSASSNSE